MNREVLDQFADENDAEILVADGLDGALIGIGQQFTKYVAVYSQSKVIEILMERDGMSRIDALEFFDVNIVGAYVGEGSPVFVWDPEEEI